MGLRTVCGAGFASRRGVRGTRVQSGTSKPFDPSSLFAAGEAGAWYDPSDLTTLFQDTASTTPVTTVGQSVALMKDKSPNGIHLAQSTSTSCPTLQQDANGNYFLLFDGVDDYMDSTVAVNNPASTGAILVYGATVVSNSGGPYPGILRFLRSGGSATSATDNRYEEYKQQATNQARSIVQRYPTAVILTTQPLFPANGAAFVASTDFNNDAGQVRYAVTTPSSVSAPIPSGLATGACTLSLARGYLGQFGNIQIYGMIFRNAKTTDATTNQVINYMKSKAGVS